MFSYDNVNAVTVVVSDPGADGTFPIWRVPSRCTKIEILEAWACLDTAMSGSGTQVALNLVDRGSSGTEVATAVSNTVGTATTGDWTAATPRLFAITEGTMHGGDYLCLGYEETGTVAPKNITVGFTWVNGIGA